MLSDCCLSVLSCLSVCLYNVGVLWPNGWMDQDQTWHAGRHQPWPHCVRWGPAPLPKGAQPQFSVHFYCGQTAGCIKMPLGMEICLSPGDFVLDGDPAPPKWHSPPIFGQCPSGCGQTAVWTTMPLGMEVRLGQATLCSMET